MARRGDELRKHILHAAKDVFIEMGFERASMDAVSARAETSKRTLYAHFESKDNLFLAVVDLVRTLYLGRLRTPECYAEDVVEAAVLYCGRFVQLLLWEPSLRTCRLSIGEAQRVQDASARYYDAIFASGHRRLATFLSQHHGLTEETGADIANQLLGRAVHPRLWRALLGVEEPLRARPSEDTIATDIDLDPIRATASALLRPPTTVPQQ